MPRTVIHDLREIGVALHELGREALEEAEQVVHDEELPVAAVPRADAVHGDGRALGDDFGHLGGDTLDEDREGACLFQNPRVLDQPQTGLGGSALRLEAPKLRVRRWRRLRTHPLW